MTKRMLIFVTVLAGVGQFGKAWAETEGKEESAAPTSEAAAQSPTPFEVNGNFELGFRVVDVNPNDTCPTCGEDQYRRHLNYETGPRLFNLDLDIAPIGSGFFDLLTIRASNLGGDPFESTFVSLRNYEKYTFNYQRRKSTYFYHDTIIPPDPDSNKSNVGDFHTFNFDRTNDLFGFDFNVTQQAKVFVNFNRQSRKGESTTTLDISRDEFELDKPLDEVKNDYIVGFQLDLQKLSFYFDETYRDYENDARIFLPGAAAGEDPEDSTNLLFYDQLQPYDFTSPQSTFRVNLRPDSRWTVTGAFIFSTLDGELGYSEASAGTDFTGTAFNRLETGDGILDRTKKLTDIDITYSVSDRFDVIGGLRFDRLDQTTEFTCLVGPCEESELEPGAIAETEIDISSNIFEIGARVFPNYTFSIGGGLRFNDRKVTAIFEDDREEEPTDRVTFFLDGTYAPSPALNVLVEYERDDYDDPFTQISPTSLDRFKVRVRGRPFEDSLIVATYLLRDAKNDITDATIDTNNLTIYGRYNVRDLMLFGDYSYQKVENQVLSIVTTAPGFQGGITFPFPTLFQSKVNVVGAGLSAPVTDTVTLGGDLKVYDNTGTFPLDWRMYRVFAQLNSPAGYLLRAAYQYNSFDEELQIENKYNSNIFTLAVGYKF